jgi:hypothetical protein
MGELKANRGEFEAGVSGIVLILIVFHKFSWLDGFGPVKSIPIHAVTMCGNSTGRHGVFPDRPEFRRRVSSGSGR